mgnify:CR=1 FL=1
MILSALLFSQLVTQCAPGDALQTLAAIARVESGFNTLSIHDNTTKTRYLPETPGEAVELAQRLLSDGHSLDLGLMQVNNNNLHALGLSVENAFDACRSIRAGAQVLRDGYKSALRVAFSRYNTGDDIKGFSNGYVKKVLAAGGIPDMQGHAQAGVRVDPLPAIAPPPPTPAGPHVVNDILHGIETPEETASDGAGAFNLFSGVAVPSDTLPKNLPLSRG